MHGTGRRRRTAGVLSAPLFWRLDRLHKDANDGGADNYDDDDDDGATDNYDDDGATDDDDDDDYAQADNDGQTGGGHACGTTVNSDRSAIRRRTSRNFGGLPDVSDDEASTGRPTIDQHFVVGSSSSRSSSSRHDDGNVAGSRNSASGLRGGRRGDEHGCCRVGFGSRGRRWRRGSSGHRASRGVVHGAWQHRGAGLLAVYRRYSR